MSAPLPDDARPPAADDQALREALLETTTPRAFAEALSAYYRDLARARRTPRDLLYLHLGMCCGLILRLTEARTEARR